MESNYRLGENSRMGDSEKKELDSTTVRFV
jgi:hypothetical protein